jgi:drug/metabolite transporter (DMT)-like permease
VSSAALGLALGAAGLHALWNLLVAGSRDPLASLAVAVAVGVAAVIPVAVLTGGVDADVWPYVAVSATLELVYFWLLARAYSRADLSVVYPVARGAAPVLVLVGALALGRTPSAIQAGGVLLIALGVLLVRGARRGETAGLALGLSVATAIAAYTLVDAEGIEHAEPAAYLAFVLAPTALVGPLAVGRRRLRAELRPGVVLAGLASVAAYGLALAALRLAPAAPVAAVRETSVLIAVALAGRALGEHLSAARVAGAALVVAGVALLAI